MEKVKIVSTRTIGQFIEGKVYETDPDMAALLVSHNKAKYLEDEPKETVKAKPYKK